MDSESELSDFQQVRLKRGINSTPVKPSGRVVASKIKNDNSPELSEIGERTDAQNFREFNYLFRFLLNGYGVSLQLQNFTHAIYTLTKPGQDYYLSDDKISVMLGLSSPNYVCAVRKRLWLWLHEKNERTGKLNPQFISVKEHKYDRESKTQLPTKYVFNTKFFDLINSLLEKARDSGLYLKDWQLAIEEIVLDNIKSLLEYGGDWNRRPPRKNRTWEETQETMLLHFANHTRKIFEHNAVKNISPEKTREQLQALTDLIYEQITRKPRKTTLKTSDEIKAALMEEVRAFLTKNTLKSVRTNLEKIKNVRSNAGQSITDAKRNAGNSETHSQQILDNQKPVRVVPTIPDQTALDNERDKFFKRLKS